MNEGTNNGGSLLTTAGAGEGEKKDVQTPGDAGKGGAPDGLTAEQTKAYGEIATKHGFQVDQVGGLVKFASALREAQDAPTRLDDKWNPKLGDGQKLDETTVKEARDFFKKQGFSTAQAQSLVEYDLARQVAADKAAEAAFTKTREGWRESIKKDAELGGANHTATMRNIQKAMTKFGASDAFKKFADGGAGDHPEFVRFVAAVGAALGEDPGVKPGSKPTASSASEEAELRKMFDKSPELFNA